MKQSSKLLLVFLTGIFISLISYQQLNACTRIVYQGPNGTIITARSMDWNEDIKSNIWIFPRGMERNGEVGPNSISWKSKYGSVITSAYDFSSSDALGDNAIFEYIGGKLVIHHDRSYVVMTNSPVYDQQLAIYDYWKEVGGLHMLPGTNRAADRFARASFYVHAIPRLMICTLP